MKGKFIYKFKVAGDHVFLNLYHLVPGRDLEKIGDTRVQRGPQFEDLLLNHPQLDFVGWTRTDKIEEALVERQREDQR